jgi:hypothetical protein
MYAKREGRYVRLGEAGWSMRAALLRFSAPTEVVVSASARRYGARAVRTELGLLLSTRRVWLCSSLGVTIWMGLESTLNSPTPPVRSRHSVSSSASNVSCGLKGRVVGVLSPTALTAAEPHYMHSACGSPSPSLSSSGLVELGTRQGTRTPPLSSQSGSKLLATSAPPSSPLPEPAEGCAAHAMLSAVQGRWARVGGVRSDALLVSIGCVSHSSASSRSRVRGAAVACGLRAGLTPDDHIRRQARAVVPCGRAAAVGRNRGWESTRL